MSIETDEQRSNGAERPPSRALKIWTAIVGFGLVTWFFVAWLTLDRHVLDAAGESIGSAFAILILASIIGALRSSRRD